MLRQLAQGLEEQRKRAAEELLLMDDARAKRLEAETMALVDRLFHGRLSTHDVKQILGVLSAVVLSGASRTGCEAWCEALLEKSVKEVLAPLRNWLPRARQSDHAVLFDMDRQLRYCRAASTELGPRPSLAAVPPDRRAVARVRCGGRQIVSVLPTGSSAGSRLAAIGAVSFAAGQQLAALAAGMRLPRTAGAA